MGFKEGLKKSASIGGHRIESLIKKPKGFFSKIMARSKLTSLADDATAQAFKEPGKAMAFMDKADSYVKAKKAI
jgi:hypothetical protein